MRVRLFEFGKSKSGRILRIDEFPAKLSIDQRGALTQSLVEESPACLIEDLGGELFVHANCQESPVCINDAEIESGPLMSGDHLRIGDQRYLVSYEQTACEFRSAIKVRVLN